MEQLQHAMKQLEKELDKYELFKVAQEKTGVPKLYLALGAASIVAIFLWLALGTPLIVSVVGFAYPAYLSVRAAQDKTDVEQWLTYWLVFGLFAVLETCEETLTYYLPLYHYIKLAVLLYCFLPQTSGAKVLYHKVILQLVPPAHKRISAVEKVQAEAQAAVDSIKANVTTVMKEINPDIVKKYE